MVIVCSNCDEVLKDKDISLQEQLINKNDIREVYYITPCCKTKNVIAFKNRDTDKLEVDIHKFRLLNDGISVTKLVKKLKREMDKLMKEYSNGIK